MARYRRALGGLGDRVVGRAAGPLLRNRLGASTGSLGALAARAQRRVARADSGFVQEGNARGDIDAGPVTYAELFEASAYEHPVMRMTMSGRGVRRVLEEQYEASPDAVLHVDGLTYERRGEGVGTVLLVDGRALDPDGRYTVAANRLLVDQEGFGAFRRHGEGMRPVGTDSGRWSRRSSAPTWSSDVCGRRPGVARAAWRRTPPRRTPRRIPPTGPPAASR